MILRRAVHFSLLAGLLASAGFLIAGLAIRFVQGQPAAGAQPPQLATLAQRALQGNSDPLLDVGLLLLVLTPVLRIVVLGIGWAVERNWRFALVAFFVMILLGFSVALGVG